MTEKEWLVCKSSRFLIDCLLDKDDGYGKLHKGLSDRQIKMILCGIYQKSGFKDVVEIMHQYFDKEITINQVNNLLKGREDERELKMLFINSDYASRIAARTMIMREEALGIIKCIAGNPFRPIEKNPEIFFVKRFDNQWVNWNNETVKKIAKEIYEKEQFQDMPILADALYEAGCDENELIKHCQGFKRCFRCLGYGRHLHKLTKCKICEGTGWLKDENRHYKGCYVLDLILGK